MMDDLDDEEPSSPGGYFEECAKKAFPNEDWDPERLSALKDLLEEASAPSDSDDDEEPSKKSDKGSLALIFGEPKKK